ncbi:MAG: helix-turn-helix domain-containing protein [Candidatus Helarchaeota archaeon]
MKFIRMRLSSDFLVKAGYPDVFNEIMYLELLNAFQYDQNSFFSLDRIVFRPELMDNWEDINWSEKIQDKLQVDFFHLLKKVDNSILCIVKVSTEKGFWPKALITPGPWAFIPPLTVDSESIKINLIIEDNLVSKLYDTIGQFTKSLEVLAINDVGKDILPSNLLQPNFTDRQREIASYAVRHGYYDSPKKIRTEAIAKHFGISNSAIGEHLRKVERSTMEFFFR